MDFPCSDQPCRIPLGWSFAHAEKSWKQRTSRCARCDESRMCLKHNDLHSKTEPREWAWSGLRSPASGSAEAAPPVCAKERTQFNWGVVAGDARRLRAQLRRWTRAGFFSQNKKNQEHHVFRTVFVFGLSLHVVSEVLAVNVGKHEDNCRPRGWWCPTMNAGWWLRFFLSSSRFHLPNF